MAWTTPRTWATSLLVTAAHLNTDIRDNMNFLYAHHGCRVWKSANQTVANGANDVITWNSETYDTDAYHDNAANNSRLTIPTGLGGQYLAICAAASDADAGNHTGVNLRLQKNAAGASGGGTIMSLTRGVGHTVGWNLPPLVWAGPLVAGDHLEIFWESVSEAHDVIGTDQTSTSFQLVYVGA